MKAIFNAKYYVEAGSFIDPESGSRYEISCISVEPHPVKGALIVATDGHVLGVWHDEQGSCIAPVLLSYDDALNRLCGIADSEWTHTESRVMEVNDDDSVTFRKGVPGGNGEVVGVLNGLVSAADFPNWRSALPKEETPRMDINPRYVNLFGKLNKSDVSRLTVWIGPFSGVISPQKAEPPAVVKIEGREDFVGVVMGMVPQRTEWPGDYFNLLRKV